MSDRLEQALFDLGQRIGYPETPRLMISVPSSAGRARRWWIAAAVVAVALIVLAFPGPRQAVANLFGIGVVRIEVIDDLPDAVIVREPSGERTSLADARGMVDFTILTPGQDPDAVYVDRAVPGGMVTLVYGDGRLYITQLPGVTEFGAVRKLLVPETMVIQRTVGDEPGFWIEGEGHALMIIDRDGGVVEDSARLAADTLLYTRDGLTIRIEGELTLDQALEIANRLD